MEDQKSWVDQAIDRAKRHPVAVILGLVVAAVVGLGAVTGALETTISFVENRITGQSDPPAGVGAPAPTADAKPSPYAEQRQDHPPPTEEHPPATKVLLAPDTTADMIHHAYLSDERVETLYIGHWIPTPGWGGTVSRRARESDSGRWYFVFQQRAEAESVAIHVWAGHEVSQLTQGDRVFVVGRITDVRTGIVVVDDATVVRDR